MGAGHSAECDGATSDPPAHSRRKSHCRRRRHSVDSVASYSSQNHVDRIRTQNFSAASCQDESDFGSIKTSLFRRSSSNLEYSVKRPESVTSTSSTRSRLREFVERKSSQDEHKPAANTVADIQYFENPTETLEFDKPRNSLEKKNQDERPKKRKLSKSKECDSKGKKNEKYQSKLADYYKLPVQLPQDEFYQHLTRSKAAEEFLQKRFSNSDTEFSGSYGRLCKHKEIEGSNLRRSRSLAVIREETFTDLQIQNHTKNKRSQLIPRARLFDKPCFRDRLTGRAKYQTKEEVLEGIYIDSTVSCFADINQARVDEDTPTKTNNAGSKSDKEDVLSRDESQHSRADSWPNLNEENKQTNLSEDSIGHSRNPSEIDSLDSNYVRKHYNFEAHRKNYKDSSPETDRSPNSCKELYITTDDPDSENETQETSIPINTDNNDNIPTTKTERSKIKSNPSDLVVDSNTYDITSASPSKDIHIKTEIYPTSEENKDCDIQSVLSENDETISSPADSITSYISISIASSTDKSHKLEYLANSLAEKIDEYCDSQFQENNLVHSQTTTSENQNLESDPIYTTVHKKTTFADLRRDSILSKASNSSNKDKIKTPTNEVYITNTFIGCNDYSQDTYCTSSKNITTEPFVTTLIENQYYSLPDLNISKCLRKSERIDAQLREEDPEDIPCENTFEIAQTHFREILSHKSNENYGQLNKINITYHNNDNNIDNSEAQIIQNFSKLEDDLKSIVTIDSSNPDENSHYYHLDHHQNEREINEIEGTIRNNKIITKSESLKIAQNLSYKPEVRILKSLSNDNINKSVKEKKINCAIKKHYSLRQRNPAEDENFRLPSPNSVDKKIIKSCPLTSKLSFSEQIKNHSLLSRVQSFKTCAESNISIVPLSGHQTIVINPPVTQEIPDTINIDQEANTQPEIKQDTKSPTETNLEPRLIKIEEGNNVSHSGNNSFQISHIAKDPFITIKLNKVVKKTIPKLNSISYETTLANKQHLQRPPPKLIISDKKNVANNNLQNNKITMTRPQVLQVIDSRNKKQTSNTYTDKAKKIINYQKPEREAKEDIKEYKGDSSHDKDKLNNAIKTDIEYQEKINSVKSYWSKLNEKSPENEKTQNKQTDMSVWPEATDGTKQDNMNRESKQDCEENNKCVQEVSVGSIIKSLESVKIVDSIRKISQTKLNLWKDETEKVKSDSEIDEPLVEKIVKENTGTIYDNPKYIKKPEIDVSRDTPEIEIVELSSDDNQNQKTQATLIKAKGYEKGCDEFDHVRYKVMKSELFKNSMIANYRKEAQFDGLLQYLQDYSFQELLVNNNIVIIEPVRTKVEPAPRKNTKTDTCKISPILLKKNEQSSQFEKSKNAVRRHFFYHPIRVNKEIIEEELPNPDTVKKVRNLFEVTLKMKSPMTHDPPLVDENAGLPRRATSYRNLSEETKSSKVGGRKKITRQLTIDTNFGNKKWDNASLSSGVSSGDLSSNNEYETDGLSPYSQKTLKDNVYSSSDEYLCDSGSQDFCCESQYVSPDILKKIRDCGTSVTYYGGKVLNSKPGSTVSPMTKAIMEEIKSLQKNCSRDCYSCQTKCRGEKCSCLVADKHEQMLSEKVGNSPATELELNQIQEKNKRSDSFPGFKFKLVKSNSCSSRLELTGADESKNPRIKFRKQNSKEDPPLINEDENSVKNKICRLESYNKGIVKSPFQDKDSDDNNITAYSKKDKKINGNIENKSNDTITIPETDEQESTKQVVLNTVQDITEAKQTNDANSFEKKFYYLNDNIELNKVSPGKFGEMVFEEFEVLENCYDSLNSNKSLK
ncbi:protein javelin isoform X2 [Bicyclus anynana]|uniref:Protein javelin isoform X2 n=1 Tax=Bicyclus anynana TaxID=110368 RepID=A0ABM3LHV8_BICAN|nr:protein javelin isoform X2 [Bicyclus anynana]